MDQSCVLGVDIGGSHITAEIVDVQTGTFFPETRSRLELNSKGSAEEILKVWTEAMRQTIDLFGKEISHIGISMPGPFDYQSGVSLIQGQDKYDALYQLNIRSLLAASLGVDGQKIGFINDAAAFLQGELLGGAALGGRNVIGVTLGTGLGSSRTISDHEVEDADLWKMPFKDSIAEEYLSTRWFVKRFLEKTSRKVGNVRELYLLAVKGNQAALSVFKEFGRSLGTFLANFIRTQGEVDIVVLGGNISKAMDLFLPEATEKLAKSNKFPAIKQALLGEDAALIGAAGIWKQELVV